jgi:hypothetical protein
MNSYELKILCDTAKGAEKTCRNYESQIDSEDDYLEAVLSKLFNIDLVVETREYNIDSLKCDTNEIQIYCYGSKFPNVAIGELLRCVEFSEVLGVQAKTIFDDGGKENYCLINNQECSVQKFGAFYRKNKLIDPAEKKKKGAKKVKPVAVKSTNNKKIDCKKDKKNELLQQLDYGKKRSCKTSIVRILSRGKVKRELVRDFFEKYLSLKSAPEKKGISKILNILSKPGSMREVWPDYDKEHAHLNFDAPDELMPSLIFVVEQDNYLYLGFDIEQLSIPTGNALDKYLNRLVLCFDAIEGVNKTWIKVRPGSNTIKERYIYYPDAGRPPQAITIDLTEDYQWPN